MRGKKLLAGILSAAMAIGTLMLPVFADDSSSISISEENYTSLKEALKAAKENETITISGSITESGFDFSSCADGITIKGKNENAILNLSGAYKAKNMKFDSIKMVWPNANYQGFQHANNLYYNNCTIEGQPFLYATTETFDNCKFIQTAGNAYNLWAYGSSNVTFNNCEFKSNGKSILIYNEGALKSATVNVNGCTFKADNAVDGKAAIEINSSLIKSGGYTLNIDSDTTKGETTATGFSENTNSGSSLYNVKLCDVVKNDDKSLKLNVEITKNNTAVEPMTSEKLAEKLNNSAAAKIGETYYETLADAAEMAESGAIITLCKNITTEAQVVFNKNITLDLNGYTFTTNYVVNDSESYAIKFIQGGKITDSATNKGKLIINNARSVSSAGQTLYIDGAIIESTFNKAGQAIIGTTAGLNMKNSKISGAAGSYALCSFSKNGTEEYVIENSDITTDTVGIYRNGSAGGFKMTVKDTSINANGTVSFISNNAESGKNHEVIFENCTLNGETGIAAKYTNLTLTNCNITATGNPSYEQTNNGSAASGFAVVLTDNSTGNAKAVPVGKIKISGGEYIGLIGLENFKSAKDDHMDKDAKTDVSITGGTFSTDVSAYCADGYVTKTEDDKYTVTKSDLTWETDTDSGYYMVDNKKLGMMRFMFNAKGMSDVISSGIMYIKAGTLAAPKGEKITANGASVFQGDIVEISEGNSGTYYAKAYIETANGTFWSESIPCSVNWNQFFTGYKGGAE